MPIKITDKKFTHMFTGDVQKRIYEFLHKNDMKAWTLDDLTKELKIPKVTIHDNMVRLRRKGKILRRRIGNPYYYFVITERNKEQILKLR